MKPKVYVETSVISYDDPIIEELHQYRAERAARFNYDIYAMGRDLIEQEKRSTAKFASTLPRRFLEQGQEVETQARLKSKLIMMMEQFTLRRISAEKIGKTFPKTWQAHRMMMHLTGSFLEAENMAVLDEMWAAGLVRDALFPTQWPTFWQTFDDAAFIQLINDVDTVCGTNYHPKRGFPVGFDTEAFYQEIVKIIQPPADVMMQVNASEMLIGQMALEPAFA